MRIVLAGTGRLGVHLLEGLRDSSHEVVAVLQDGRRTRGFRRVLDPWLGRFFGGAEDLAGKALRAGLPLIWIDRMTEEELAPLRALEPDLLLVGGFGIILKRPLLDLPRIGCVNTHSSLLPRHRGPNPFSAAILAGDTETGVTFHVMTEGIDDGDILDQTSFAIEEDDGMFAVYRLACALAGERVAEVMDTIEREGLCGVPQDPALATYEKKRFEDDTWIDWRRPAIEIDRMVRALATPPMARFLFRDRVVRVGRIEFAPEPVDAAPGVVLSSYPLVRIATGQGSVRLRVAFLSKPVPWIFPAPWCRPATGEQLPLHGCPDSDEDE